MRKMELMKEQMADGFQKRYPDYIKVLEKSALHKVLPHGIGIDQVNHIGRMLEQVDNYIAFRMQESSQADLGVYPTVYRDALVYMYGQAPMGAICAIQPMNAQQDLIYFQQMTAQTTRGSITSGDVLFNTLATPTNFDDGSFTGEQVANLNFLSVTSGFEQSYTNADLTGGGVYQTPLNPQRVFLSGSFTVTISSAPVVVSFTNLQANPTTGNFSYMAMSGTTPVGISGTVDFANGTVDLTFSQTPSAAVSLNVSYQTLVEEAADVQTVDIDYVTQQITAQTFTLKALMGFFKAFEMQKRFGFNYEQKLTETLASQMNQTLFQVVLNKLVGSIPSNNEATWTQAPPTGVSYEMHQKSFDFATAMASDLIVKTAGRGLVNYMVAGRNASTVIASMPEFKLAFDGTTFGPHIYGSYKGIPVIRVPYANQLDENTILGGYKGSDFEAPVVFAPYLPMVVTDVKNLSPNPFQTQKACGVMAAIDTMVPNLQSKIVINTTGFNSIIAIS